MLNKTEVPEIKKAVVFLHEMSADEEVKENVRRREIAIRDQMSAIDYARGEGEKIGETKGEKNEREKTIERMRQLGYSEEKIKEIYNF